MREINTPRVNSWLKKLVLKTIVPQLKNQIGVDPADEFMLDMGQRKLVWRAIQRGLIFGLSGQADKKIDSLKACQKRGLWLYFGEGQLGDALMDLAPRTLLTENGFHLDLLTDKNLAKVFKNDPWFGSVSDDASSFAPSAYDFAIVLSHKRRSIECKRKYFENLPWVSIHEGFAGPNFDRSGFATQRLADLLNLTLSPKEFSRHANQKLRTLMTGNDSCSRSRKITNAITLCIGGVDPLRTYSAWPSVISELLDHGMKEFVLVGSNNGIEMAELINRAFHSKAVIHDFVDKCTIAQSHDLIAATRLVISADGGLLHLAATTTTPIVAIFSSNIRPEWRLKAEPASTFLWSPSLDVNAIHPKKIAEKVCNFLNKINEDSK